MLSLSNSLTTIDDDTFGACFSLTSMVIPNSVQSIGADAFSTCMGLTSVEIPASVRSISPKAFQYCTGLIDVYCYAVNVPESNSDTFYGSNTSKAKLYIPTVALEAYKASAPWSDFGSIVSLTDEEVRSA